MDICPRETVVSARTLPSLQNVVVESLALLGAAWALEHTAGPLSEQHKPPGGNGPRLYLLPW